jgi:cytoskeletal protein CcmA (bactofilin family)
MKNNKLFHAPAVRSVVALFATLAVVFALSLVALPGVAHADDAVSEGVDSSVGGGASADGAAGSTYGGDDNSASVSEDDQAGDGSAVETEVPGVDEAVSGAVSPLAGSETCGGVTLTWTGASKPYDSCYGDYEINEINGPLTISGTVNPGVDLAIFTDAGADITFDNFTAGSDAGSGSVRIYSYESADFSFVGDNVMMLNPSPTPGTSNEHYVFVSHQPLTTFSGSGTVSIGGQGAQLQGLTIGSGLTVTGNIESTDSATVTNNGTVIGNILAAYVVNNSSITGNIWGYNVTNAGTVNGNVYSDNNVINTGTVNGDVRASGTITNTGGTITGTQLEGWSGNPDPWFDGTRKASAPVASWQWSSSNSARINWTTPSDMGNPAANYYWAEVREKEDPYTTKCTGEIYRDDVGYSFTMKRSLLCENLEDGVVYTVWVEADYYAPDAADTGHFLEGAYHKFDFTFSDGNTNSQPLDPCTVAGPTPQQEEDCAGFAEPDGNLADPNDQGPSPEELQCANDNGKWEDGKCILPGGGGEKGDPVRNNDVYDAIDGVWVDGEGTIHAPVGKPIPLSIVDSIDHSKDFSAGITFKSVSDQSLFDKPLEEIDVVDNDANTVTFTHASPHAIGAFDPQHETDPPFVILPFEVYDPAAQSAETGVSVTLLLELTLVLLLAGAGVAGVGRSRRLH